MYWLWIRLINFSLYCNYYSKETPHGPYFVNVELEFLWHAKHCQSSLFWNDPRGSQNRNLVCRLAIGIIFSHRDLKGKLKIKWRQTAWKSNWRFLVLRLAVHMLHFPSSLQAGPFWKYFPTRRTRPLYLTDILSTRLVGVMKARIEMRNSYSHCEPDTTRIRT